MASFYSGDQVGALVADVGQHTTKIGWAGNDFPRCHFRSNIAVQRGEKAKSSGDDDDEAELHEPITKAKYDYYHSPIEKTSDGNWQTANPVEPSSGLWLDKSPKADGSDWNDLLNTLLNHGYSSLKCDPKDHPVLLVERSYNPPAVRQQTLQVLFEEIEAPAVFLSKEAVLSCYACGRTSGTVVDVGYSGTTVSPVFEGFVETKGVRRSPVGLCQMDQQILNDLDELNRQPVKPYYQKNHNAQRGPAFHQAARLYMAQECRELGAGASMNTAPAGSNNTTFHAPHKQFELPDGTPIDVPSAKRFAVAALAYGDDPTSVERRQEIVKSTQKSLEDLVDVAKAQQATDGEDYGEAAAVGLSKRRKRSAQKKAQRKKFSNRPLLRACSSHLEKLNSELMSSSSVANMVCEAAYRCERDQQGVLLGNVVLGGGGACLGPTEQAVPDALREQVEGIIQQHTPGWRVKMLSPGLPERAILSWLGGSVLGSLGTFHDMWITKEEYEEWGSAIVNRKCP